MTPNGILAAAITPRRGLTIDTAAACDLAGFLASKRVAGIVAFGSTGEFVHFDIDARAALTRELVKQSKIPILANVSHSTLDGTIELARRALADGAAAAVAMPPYYFRYTQPQVREFFLRLGDAVDGPISLYNIPLFTTELAVATAQDLLATGRFCALKDSSGDPAYIEALLPNHTAKIYVGSDSTYRRLKAKGVNGAVSGVASVAPELMIALDHAVATGNEALANTAERLLLEFLDWFLQFPIPAGIAQALEVRCGYPCPVSIPLDAGTQAKLNRFRDWSKSWIQEVESQCKI